MPTPDKPGRIRASEVRTPRLRHHVLFSGDGDGPVVVFVHGNLSTARFFEQDLAALPDGYRGIAADLRGFGHSEAAPVDAVRGVRDFADDLAELLTSPEAGGAGRGFTSSAGRWAAAWPCSTRSTIRPPSRR